MTVRWLQAVIDIPADRFATASEFWRTVSGSTFGEVHPDHEEFVHLVPPNGDMHLELQRTNDDQHGVHLDLLVDDIDMNARRATDLGARIVAHPGHAVLETPGGVTFCLVPFSSEAKRAPVIEDPVPHAVDQVCVDVPAEYFDSDVAFWSALTGWKPNPQILEEFCSFAQPRSLPIRLLLQRLGANDTAGARAHLDLACGDNVGAVVDRHVSLGATLIEIHQRWTVMNDPAGMPYCLTQRPPQPT
jgi:predicted enzyme related to lactoylglutathione lyase